MAIYDAFGREIDVRAWAQPDNRVLSVASVRDRYAGYPSRGLTPEKLALIFKEADSGDVYRQMELFEEMEEKDAHLFSVMQTRRQAVAGLDFEVVPASEDAKDIEVADFVSAAVNGLPNFEDNLLNMLDGVGKGYSALEIYWSVVKSRNMAAHLEWVHPKRFAWWLAAGTTGAPDWSWRPRLITDSNPSGIDLPPFKFIFHRHLTKSGYPTRQGVLRVCAFMYLFKNYGIKDWVVFAEVFGMPLRLGKYDPSATKDDKDALINALRSLGSDAAGVISKSTEIDFIEAAKNSGKDVYDTLVAFCNAEISKAVLGQTLTTQQGQSGSYSLGRVHDSVRRDILKADCESVAKTIRRDLIAPLVGFNFGWDTPLPWFKFHYEEPEDLKLEAEKIKTLVDAGFEGIPEDYVHEKFNIPKPAPGQKTIYRPVPPVPQAAVSANKADTTTATASPQKDSIDLMVERLMREADFTPMMEPVARAVATAKSMTELRDNLLELYKNMDTSGLGTLLQRAFSAAELLGRFQAASK